MDLRKFYDEHAEEYIDNTQELQPAWLERFVELMPGKRVLDVGCAYGRDMQTFAEKGLEVFGIDISKKMIALASPFGDTRVMDMRSLEFPDNHFDGVWCSASLLHLEKKDVPGTLKGFRRVLSEKGVLYVSVKMGEGEGPIKDARYGGAEKFYAFYTPGEIRGYVEQAGFTIQEEKTRPSHFSQFHGTIEILAS